MHLLICFILLLLKFTTQNNIIRDCEEAFNALTNLHHYRTLKNLSKHFADPVLFINGGSPFEISNKNLLVQILLRNDEDWEKMKITEPRISQRRYLNAKQTIVDFQVIYTKGGVEAADYFIRSEKIDGIWRVLQFSSTIMFDNKQINFITMG